MVTILIADARLARPSSGISRDFLGPPHRVVIPETFAAGAAQPGLSEADVLLTGHAPVTAAMMAAAPRLRLIAKAGSGVDNIDVEAATTRGIMVANAPGARSPAVAEHALFLAMAVARRPSILSPRQGRVTARELRGTTLGILGYGAIGSRLAQMSQALDMDVVACTRTPPAAPVPGVEFVDLKQVFTGSDVLVVCTSLTPETLHLVDEPLLRTMPSDAILVNVSRGPVVRTDDLVTVLRSGRLLGAGLDVTDPEPLPQDHPLRALPNVVLTPHVAGQTREAQQRAVACLHRNVQAALEGRLPPDLVNPAVVP